MGWLNNILGGKRKYEEEEEDEEEEEEISLICPYCNKEIKEPISVVLDDNSKDEWYLCGCENCKEVLGGTYYPLY